MYPDNEPQTPLTLLLGAAQRALAARMENGIRDAGHIDLRAAHAQVFVAMDAEGSRLTDLAARAGMTKQAMGELVRYLEQRGYLVVKPDVRDRRARLIRPTASGQGVYELCRLLVADNDRRLADRLGDQTLHQLRALLDHVCDVGVDDDGGGLLPPYPWGPQAAAGAWPSAAGRQTTGEVTPVDASEV